MTNKRRANIRDVASAAEVSIATVSKFMNKLQRFSPEVEARIRRAVDTLNYHQSLAARSLIAGHTRTVALAVQDVHNPYFTDIFNGASKVAAAHEYTVLIVNLQENAAGERGLLTPLARRVDGFIITSRDPDDDWLIKLGKPVICVGPPTRQLITTVRSDSYQAGYMLGKHLVEVGRQRIAFLGLPSDAYNFQGLCAALAESGLTPSRHDALLPTLEGGREATSAMLLEGSCPDAVVCRNDLMAIGVMHAARSLGLRVPRDVAVTGCDDIPVSRFIQPALTTIDMRSEEQGEIAMQRLASAILQEDVIEDIVIEPRLIVRASTGSE